MVHPFLKGTVFFIIFFGNRYFQASIVIFIHYKNKLL